jgi:hypothetical protein
VVIQKGENGYSERIPAGCEAACNLWNISDNGDQKNVSPEIVPAGGDNPARCNEREFRPP